MLHSPVNPHEIVPFLLHWEYAESRDSIILKLFIYIVLSNYFHSIFDKISYERVVAWKVLNEEKRMLIVFALCL